MLTKITIGVLMRLVWILFAVMLVTGCLRDWEKYQRDAGGSGGAGDAGGSGSGSGSSSGSGGSSGASGNEGIGPAGGPGATWGTARRDASTAVCGDGVIARGEQCDGSNLAGETCTSLGQGVGRLACYPATCTFDVSMCREESPGQPPDTVWKCRDLAAKIPVDLPRPVLTDLINCLCENCLEVFGPCIVNSNCSVIVACAAETGCDVTTCPTDPVCGPIISEAAAADPEAMNLVLPLSECNTHYGCTTPAGTGGTGGGPGYLCGDGIVEGNEQCDSFNLSGETCYTLGGGSGTLGCDPVTCTFDLSMCTG